MEASQACGRYDGDVEVGFLPDGRSVKLLKQFAYIDASSERWDVPEGAIVDGASIPQVLWSLIKGPFEGKYRNASVVHDWYCDLRSRPWQKVHRVFYEAMLTSGVAPSRARLMYGAVYWGGPKWSRTVESNVNLLIERYRQTHPEAKDQDYEGSKFYYRPDPHNHRDPRNYPVVDTITTTVTQYKLTEADVAELERAVEVDNLRLDEIDSLVNRRVEALPNITVATYVRKMNYIDDPSFMPMPRPDRF